jgi:hypothetical protein
MKHFALILLGLSLPLISCHTTANQQTPAPIAIAVDPARGIRLTNLAIQSVELKYKTQQPITITDGRGNSLPAAQELQDFTHTASVDASTPLAMLQMQHERFPGSGSLTSETLMPEYAVDRILLKPGSTHILPAYYYSDASPPAVVLCAGPYDATQISRFAGVSGEFILQWRYPGSGWQVSPPLPVKGRLDLRRLPD